MGVYIWMSQPVDCSEHPANGARMVIVVEQAEGAQDREGTRKSRPIQMQQDGQGTSLSHAAKQ